MINKRFSRRFFAPDISNFSLQNLALKQEVVLLPLESSETGTFPFSSEWKHLQSLQPFHQLSYFFFNPQRGFSVICIHKNATSIIWNCCNERKHGPIKVHPPTLLTVITEY